MAAAALMSQIAQLDNIISFQRAMGVVVNTLPADQLHGRNSLNAYLANPVETPIEFGALLTRLRQAGYGNSSVELARTVRRILTPDSLQRILSFYDTELSPQARDELHRMERTAIDARDRQERQRVERQRREQWIRQDRQRRQQRDQRTSQEDQQPIRAPRAEALRTGAPRVVTISQRRGLSQLITSGAANDVVVHTVPIEESRARPQFLQQYLASPIEGPLNFGTTLSRLREIGVSASTMSFVLSRILTPESLDQVLRRLPNPQEEPQQEEPQQEEPMPVRVPRPAARSAARPAARPAVRPAVRPAARQGHHSMQPRRPHWRQELEQLMSSRAAHDVLVQTIPIEELRRINFGLTLQGLLDRYMATPVVGPIDFGTVLLRLDGMFDGPSERRNVLAQILTPESLDRVLSRLPNQWNEPVPRSAPTTREPPAEPSAQSLRARLMQQREAAASAATHAQLQQTRQAYERSVIDTDAMYNTVDADPCMVTWSVPPYLSTAIIRAEHNCRAQHRDQSGLLSRLDGLYQERTIPVNLYLSDGITPQHPEYFFRTISTTLRSGLSRLTFQAKDSPVIDLGGVRREFFSMAGDYLKSILLQDTHGYYYLSPGLPADYGRAIRTVILGSIINHAPLNIQLSHAWLFAMVHGAGPFTLDTLMTLQHMNSPDELEQYCQYITDMSLPELIDHPFTEAHMPVLKNLPVAAIGPKERLEWLRRFLTFQLFGPIDGEMEAFVRSRPQEGEALPIILASISLRTLSVAMGRAITKEDMLKIAAVSKPQDHPIIEFIVRYIEEAEPEKWMALLRFGTASVNPNNVPRFEVDPHHNGLPVAHTCFNKIDVQNYTDYETFKEELDTSLRNGTGFGIG